MSPSARRSPCMAGHLLWPWEAGGRMERDRLGSLGGLCVYSGHCKLP